MSWIPFYADEADFRPIIERLNADAEVAILWPAGRGRWIARAQVAELPDGKYILWHIPGGPLPLLSNTAAQDDATIADPFAGWAEQRRGTDASVPYFGSIPNVFELRKATRGSESRGSIGLSSFGWLGNRYKSLGMGAARATALWSRRMQRWVQHAAVEKIPRWDSPGPPPAEIWALPAAYTRIRAGAARDANSHL